MKRRILLLLTEKSTYAGAVAFLAGSAAFGLSAETWASVASALSAIAGLFAMLLLEKGDEVK